MHDTARMNQQKCPVEAGVITRNNYVEDILKSAPNIGHAKNMIKEIENVLMIGSFKVKDFWSRGCA